MHTFPSSLSLAKLSELAALLEEVVDEGYVTMAARQSTRHLLAFPEIKAAADELKSLRKLDPVYVMVNKMPAGKTLPWHQDWLEPTPLQPYKGPLIERWHLPITTNNKVLWFDSTHPWGFHMPKGVWCGPVPYWNKHYVENLGTKARVHLIVDLDCPEPCGMYE
jgi:hypothetical protein